MADLQVYMERIAGRAPTKTGVSGRGGTKSRWTLLIGSDGVAVDAQGLTHPAITSNRQVHNAIKEIMGLTTTHKDGLRLKRILPKADPFSPWLFADDLEYSGRGKPTLTAATPFGGLEAPTLDTFALYPCYEFDVSFTTRMYSHVQDESVETGTMSWTDQAGTVHANTRYAKEWVRYVDVETVPSAEYITSQAGQFVIDVDPAGGVEAADVKPDGVQGGLGQLRMLVSKQAKKFTWFQVPYKYVETGDPTNIPSNIAAGLGCVNQLPWNGYPAGTLLFEALGISRYPMPIGIMSNTWVPDYTTNIIYVPALYCDISFVFLYFDPPLGKRGDGNTATPRTPPAPKPGLNAVTRGHNRVPYAHTMSWYYARTKVTNFTDADGFPLFPSYPFELLWTNPGVTVP